MRSSAREVLFRGADGGSVDGQPAPIRFERSLAWSGAAATERVEVRVGDAAWHDARLLGERKRHTWQRWEFVCRVQQPGPITLCARTTDLAGRSQPDRAEWNRLGYGNNTVQRVPVRMV